MYRKRTLGIALLFMTLLLTLAPGLMVQADFGTNWTATLFANTSLTEPGVTVGVSQINWNWGTNPPSSIGATIINCPNSPDCKDNFSIRFTSSQTFAAGTYQFVVAADDTVRVLIDGNPWLNSFNPSSGRPLTTETFNVTLTAGPHNITVEYNEFIGEAVIQVQWFLQGQGGTPGLFGTSTPIGTAVPALSVQVKNVKGLSLRTGPYLGASLVSVVRPGTSYAPIARNLDEGTYTWFLITVDTHTGWASGRYLEVAGDPNSVPIQSTVFEQIDGAPDTGVRAAPRSIMNFRRRPSQRATSLGQISWGENLELLGRTIQGGENFWFQVRYNGQVGWIYAPFVSTYGDINVVPIR
jgi:uncharacterized protein YraI